MEMFIDRRVSRYRERQQYLEEHKEEEELEKLQSEKRKD